MSASPRADRAIDDITVGLASSDSVVLGIDLGTSNSCACVVINGQPEVLSLELGLADSGGSRTIPSVVAFDERGRAVVGSEALASLIDQPRRAIYGAKRFVGRAYDSLEVQRMLPRFPYKIVPGREGRVAVDVDGNLVSLINISGRILKAVREGAERRLKRPVRRAVVTVPAYYNDNQRDAVVRAGQLAGLRIERILNEPTAAAIAYGVVRSHERTILVYDLGGGTFDVPVMAVERGRLRVLASAGDTFLGGDDFDAAIVDHIRQRFAREYRKHLSQDPQTVALLKARAEFAKKRLSSCHTTMFTVRQVRLIGGAKERIELELSRAEVEEAVSELVTRTLAITTQATQEARVKPSQIADVLLVGGQTRMPFVRYAVARHFGIEPRFDLNPDEVVAFGAGLFAHLPRGKTSAFQDVLAMSIGIGVGQRFQPLLKRNTPVPCSSALTFKVSRSAFAQASIALWQGDEPELYRNEKLGMLRVDVLDPGDADPVPLRVDLALSPDCLLRLTMQNLATGEMRHVLLNTRDGVE